MDELELDHSRLDSYLTESIAGFAGPVISQKFSGGQSNPTYLLNADSGKYVLRRKPPGQLLKSAHAVEREYRVMQALTESGVPVPRAFHLCNDESIIGSVFFIMEYIEGQIYWDPALPDLSRLRQTRRLLCPSDQALDSTVSCFTNRNDHRDGSGYRLATRQSS